MFSCLFVSKDFESRSVNLIAADPPDACFSVTNGPALHKSIALVDRGLVHVKACAYLSVEKSIISEWDSSFFVEASQRVSHSTVVVAPELHVLQLGQRFG